MTSIANHPNIKIIFDNIKDRYRDNWDLIRDHEKEGISEEAAVTLVICSAFDSLTRKLRKEVYRFIVEGKCNYQEELVTKGWLMREGDKFVMAPEIRKSQEAMANYIYDSLDYI